MTTEAPNAMRPRYDAFISYSQDPDLDLARGLKAALAAFGRKWWQWRGVRAVLDTATFGASDDLDAAIKARLLASGHLIVLASRAAVGKPWVRREVEAWLAKNGAQRLLLALTDGELCWDGASGDFSPKSSALPEPLFGRFPKQPLWVDLRGARQDAEALRLGAARLASAILGRDVDDLLSDELTQHRRRQRVAVGAGVLLLATVGAAGWQMQRARQEGRAAESRRAAASAMVSIEHAPLTALRDSIRAVEIAPTFEARSALWSWLSRRPELRKILADPERQQWETTFAPDGQSFIALATGRPLELRESRSGRLLRRAAQPAAQASCLALSHDGKHVATGRPDGRIDFWDVETFAPAGTLHVEPEADQQQRKIRSLAWEPGDRALLAGDEDGGLRRWELPARAEARRWRREVGRRAVVQIAVAPGGHLAAGVAEQKALKLVALPGGELSDGPSGIDANVASAAFTPDDAKLVLLISAAGSEAKKRNLRVWDLREHKIVSEQYAPFSLLDHLLVSADGTMAARYSHAGLRWLFRLDKPALTWPGRNQGIVGDSISAAPQLDRWVTAIESGERLLWQAGDGPLHRSHGDVDLYGFKATSGVSADGRWMIARNKIGQMPSGQPVLLDLAGGVAPRPLMPAAAGADDPPETSALCLAPSGRRAAWVRQSDPAVIMLWDIALGQPTGAPMAFAPPVRQTLLLDDRGTLALVTDDGGLWFAAAGAAPQRLATSAVERITPVAGGETVIAGFRDGSVSAWRPSDRKELWRSSERDRHASKVTDLQTSRDGLWLLSVGEDQTLRLWQTRNGALKASAKVGGEGALSVACSPDGAIAAVGCKDAAVRLYSLPKLEPLARLDHLGVNATDSVEHLAFDHRGWLVVAADLQVHTFNLSFADWLATARELLAAPDAASAR